MDSQNTLNEVLVGNENPDLKIVKYIQTGNHAWNYKKDYKLIKKSLCSCIIEGNSKAYCRRREIHGLYQSTQWDWITAEWAESYAVCFYYFAKQT